MNSYKAPTSVRSDQLKRYDLVRVNTFVGAKEELEIWSTVLAIVPGQSDQGTKVTIQLAGGYQFVAKPDKQYYCRVAVDH